MNKFTLAFYALIIVLPSCNQSDSKIEAIELLDTGFHHYSDLQENQVLIGDVSSFAMMDDGGFVVADVNSPKLVIYDKDGSQTKVIPAAGDGPLQFLNPSLVKYYNGKIYLWCNQQLKLITYDRAGNPIEEFKLVDRAVSNFILYENKVVVYTKGGFRGPFIQVYNLTSREMEASLGEVSDEQVLLDIYSCSGGLEVKNNLLGFMASDKLDIHRYDLRRKEDLANISIPDDEFNVRKINRDPVDLVNSGFEKVIEYIHENSVVMGIFSLDEGHVVISEVGEYEGNPSTEGSNSSKRYTKYYFLNDSFEVRKVYQSSKSPQESPCLIESKGDKLYQLSRVQHADGERFVMNEFSR